MENASKALLMAGGILIGILVLSLFVYEMQYVSSTSRIYEEEMARTQVLQFNRRFEIYTHDGKGQREKMKAQDVATLYSWVKQWNDGGEGHPNDRVELKFGTGYNLKAFFNNPSNTIEEFLIEYSDGEFNCTNLEYRENDGRVSSVTISCIKN